MADKKDVVKDEVKKKTLQAKNKANALKEKTSQKEAEVKAKAVDMKDDVKDKALEIKKGGLEKTADAKESALMKTEEIKADASAKTEEIKEDTSDKTAEFRENAEKTRKQAERKINEFISSLKGKQEELGKTISDYTSTKPLTDVIDTADTIIIQSDLPRVKKEDISVNITEDSVEIIAKFEETDEDLEFIKKERNYGETTRTIPLPVKIEVKKASAKFEDSVLTLELPKVQEEKVKVDIK
jgi:HSP20 family protein